MAKNTTTRWDALSMRDRASLIKLYSQSGIKKLDDMRAHYNRFDTGGDTDGYLWYNPQFDATPTVVLDPAVVSASVPVVNNKKTKQDKYNDELAKKIIEQTSGAPRNELGLPAEKPLENEDYIFGALATGAAGLANGAARATGPAVARAIEYVGEKAMPSSLLKGASYYLPDIAGEAAAISPYVDAAALLHWTNQGYRAASKAFESGDTAGGVGLTAVSSLPLVMPVAFNHSKIINNVKASTKAAKQAAQDLKNFKFASGELANVSDLEKAIPEFKFETPRRIVNEDGTINSDMLSGAYRDVLRFVNSNSPGPRLRMNETYSSSGKNTTLKKHTEDVVKTAQEIPVPKGSSRAELVRSALAHDIGKIVSGQEGAHPNHGVYSARILQELGNKYPEFATDPIKSAVGFHMYDEWRPNGLGTSYRKHGVEQIDPMLTDWQRSYSKSINYDLVHALQAADVARGLSYDEAASRFPQLFTYLKENPANVTFYKGTEAEQLQNVINPILKRYGYQTISSKEDPQLALYEKLRRHRSFLRGVRDPDGAKVVNTDNVINANEEALSKYGLAASETRQAVALTNIAKSKTGYGRASFTDSGPNLSDRLKVDPERQDALYVSVSPELARTYASRDNKIDGMVGKVTLPMEFDPQQQLVEMLESGEFQLYNGNNVIRGTKPMSDWQLYEEPYRIQTGRSLLSDMRNEYKQLHPNTRIADSKSTTHLESPEYVTALYLRDIDKYIPEFKQAGIKFNPYKEVNGKVMINRMAVMDLNDGINKLRERKFKSLKDLNLISEKQYDLYEKISSRQAVVRDAKAAAGKQVQQWVKEAGFKSINDVDTYQLDSWRNAAYMDAYDAALDKHDKKVSDFIEKYIKPSALKNIKERYYKDAAKKYKNVNADFLKFMKNKIGFMRSHSVVPLYEMPSFGRTELFSTNGTSWGTKQATRNFAPTTDASQAIIIGNRGDAVVDLEKVFSPQEVIDLTGPNYRKLPSGRRDAGHRMLLEDPRYAITRKTFATGGDRNVSKNLAYKIGAYAHDDAGITTFGILDALTSKQKKYDELKAFIYGPETAGFTEYTGLSRKPFFNKQAKAYNGNINPNNEYVFPENMKGFLEEVASRNGNIYLNADLMPGSEKQRYDAANYPLNLRFDSSGNIIGNAADLYDFDPDYTKRYKKAHKWQAKIMEKQGNPYIVRQDNIPFRFVEDVDDKDAIKTLTAFSYGELGSPADISDTAIVNTMERLGNGTIEPSVVKANLPTYYEYYNADNYANGGKIYIKPKNRGKFNALLKRTGKSASWFKAHGTPLQRKRATFALNAKKWKHSNGGTLDINTKFFDE